MIFCPVCHLLLLHRSHSEKGLCQLLPSWEQIWACVFHSSTTQEEKWTWCHYRCSACQGLAWRPSREVNAPEGLKQAGSLTGLPCLQRLAFTGILTPKVLGTPLCPLHYPRLPMGKKAGSYPCSEGVGR